MMKHSGLVRTLVFVLILGSSAARAELYVTIVQGLGGLPEYAARFDEQRSRIAGASTTLVGAGFVSVFNAEAATRERLLAHFSTLKDNMQETDRAAIYLIGHGSYDGQEYKFNIPGPDLSDADLETILTSLPGQNHFLLNTSSTSGAYLETLAKDGRILITATRNGNERNATEFGAFFAEALASESADINKNENISVQEAFDYAQRAVTGFYESAGKLATEHPQIRGEGAARFSLARIGSLPQAKTQDPALARLLEQRLELDARIEDLQLRRDQLGNEAYLEQFQQLILESARVSEEIENLSGEADGLSP
ncbi:MAG: C13 family peptidase [Pseudomonadales bacterium]|nr:C13 family peptidase [Pseudomonadales bacterium]